MLKVVSKRPGWYYWDRPDLAWVQTYAETPGLQWVGNGQIVTGVTLHLSHVPLLPDYVRQHAFIPAPPPVPAHVPVGMLRAYQAEDLPFLRSRRGSLLAYEMRLGKTITSCMAHDPKDGILVVVGPLASRDVWKRTIEQVHGYPPLVLQGIMDTEPQFGYPAYFVHYDILFAHTELFARIGKIGTLIIDECHLLQNRSARRVHAMSALTPHAQRIIGLSGTPMWNNPDSMYAMLHLITPGAWGGHHAYGLRYCGATPGAHGWKYTSSSHEDEMSARLNEIVCRRTWADVAPQLPPTTRVVEPVDVTPSQLAGIEAAATHAALARGTATVAGYMATLRRKLGAVKVMPAVQTTLQAMLDGHKVVVWVWHRELGDKIAAALRDSNITVYRLQAEDSANVREAEVERFRQAPGPCAFVASIAAGGVAIDLSCSDYAVFAELDYVPAMVYQAEMRTFHPSRPHVVVYLYADTPIEAKLVNALGVREGFSASLGLGFNDIAQLVLGI